MDEVRRVQADIVRALEAHGPMSLGDIHRRRLLGRVGPTALAQLRVAGRVVKADGVYRLAPKEGEHG